MKKVQLERILQGLDAVPASHPEDEQVQTPAGIAAELAYFGAAKGDLAEARVLDLGCGNGILAIAVKLLGSPNVVGVDRDATAVEVARGNGRRVGADVEWRHEDVTSVDGPFDTVVTNPPFGAQRRHADRPFIDKALQVGRVAYSFHNGLTESYVRNRIQTHGGRVTDRVLYDFPIPRSYPFHRDEIRRIPVVLLRTEVVGNAPRTGVRRDDSERFV